MYLLFCEVARLFGRMDSIHVGKLTAIFIYTSREEWIVSMWENLLLFLYILVVNPDVARNMYFIKFYFICD